MRAGESSGWYLLYNLSWNVPIYIRPIISYEIKFYKGLCNMPIAGSLNQIWSECFNEIILLTKTISFIPRSCPLPSPHSYLVTQFSNTKGTTTKT